MTKPFSPLLFLASLGAGGISVIPFSFLNYTFPHPKGLIQIAQIGHGTLPLMQEILFRFMELTMIVFVIIHILLTIKYIIQLIKWFGSKEHKKLRDNPLHNSSIVTPFISIIMTMNVFIGPVRFFIPQLGDNLQSFMFPALIIWSILWILLMNTEIALLKTSFEKDFDINKIHFGWLLNPFALAMLTVTGTGIAALSNNPGIAHISAFMSMISGSMGFFLLTVKLVALFKSHFASSGMPEKQFYPSFLIVIPNITLYAISAFRIGHYLEKFHSMEMGAYFLIVTTLAFAFETWYLLFGVSLLKDYFKQHFRKEFYISQWGLVCPIVAYAVLGTFVYATFVQNVILYWTIIATTIIAIVIFFTLLYKQCKCKKGTSKIHCY
ncbi:hypothetical protein KKD70_01770 [Patescibacteria group bacterium]|nr:hypothetical protein [Patescibacteria group bacterium]